MRRGRTLILLILIIVIAAVLAFVYLNGQQGQQTPAEQQPAALDLVDVIVAGQPINQGSLISEEQLATIQIPRSSLVAVLYTNDQINDVIGKKALYPIAQGVPITSELIGEPNQSLAASGPDWATQLAPGETAVAVPISRLQSVAYGATDGAHVNVVACMLFVDVDAGFQSITPNNTAVVTGVGYLPEQLPVMTIQISEGGPQGRVEVDPALQSPLYVLPSEQQRPRLVCQMFFQDVRVMHLGDFPYQNEVNIGANASDGQAAAAETATGGAVQAPQQTNTTGQKPDIITLIMSPQDAVTMNYLIYSGAQLALTLRSPQDDTRIATEAATLQFILSQYNVPIPLKLPYALQPPLQALTQPVLPNDLIQQQP
jgi:pilus assembly protein CpaB